jgi:hypothetical protein
VARPCRNKTSMICRSRRPSWSSGGGGARVHGRAGFGVLDSSGPSGGPTRCSPHTVIPLTACQSIGIVSRPRPPRAAWPPRRSRTWTGDSRRRTTRTVRRRRSSSSRAPADGVAHFEALDRSLALAAAGRWAEVEA